MIKSKEQIIMEKHFKEVQKILPDMSETECDIARQRLYEGYTVQDTVGTILYGSMGGYSLKEYISDIKD